NHWTDHQIKDTGLDYNRDSQGIQQHWMNSGGTASGNGDANNGASDYAAVASSAMAGTTTNTPPAALIRRRSASDLDQTSTTKRPFRFYWANDEHMYWTLLLDSTNTVRDITLGLQSKVPTGLNVYIYKRTKGKFGITKDRRLSNEDSIWEIVDSRRANNKSEPNFVLKKKKASSLNIVSVHAKKQSHHHSHHNDGEHNHSHNNNNNNNITDSSGSAASSTTHTPPMYQSSPVQQRHNGLQASPAELGPLPTSSGETTDIRHPLPLHSSLRSPAVKAFKELVQSQQHGGSGSGNNSGSNSPLNSSPQQQHSPSKTRNALANNQSSGGSPVTGRPSPFSKRAAALDSTSSMSSGAKIKSNNKEKDVMRLMRFYFGDLSSINYVDATGGRFFTLALTKETTARDVGISVEQKLQLPPSSITVFLILPLQSNGSKIERMLGDDELIIDIKDTWEDPAQTFFIVKEADQKPPINKRLSKHITDLQQHNIIPNEWRRSTDCISLRFPPSPEQSWKRRSIPIFLQVLPGNGKAGVGPSPLGGDADANNGSGNTTPGDVVPKGDDDGDDDDNSGIDIKALMGWAHLIPSQDLEYIKRIGSGTYSKVYKGRYNDKFVAIKTLRGNTTPDQIQSFRKECDILSTIRSPHLISFFGSCIEDSQLSMVVEYCSRGTLHKVLNTSFDFEWDKWFRWMMQVVEGAHYLHNMNPPTVHRDLKTLNILISAEYNAKLCDFGLTRTMTMTNVSTLGMLRGTMAYTAPEIYDGMLFNTKSDVYSLGVIMWELVQRCITGVYQRPFHDYPISMDIQIIILTSKNKVRPKIIETCPQALRNLIVRCWDQVPEARPTTTAILAELHSLKMAYDENKQSWDDLRTKTVKPPSVTSPKRAGAVVVDSNSNNNNNNNNSNQSNVSNSSSKCTDKDNNNNNSLGDGSTQHVDGASLPQHQQQQQQQPVDENDNTNNIMDRERNDATPAIMDTVGVPTAILT
ncbi:hypothetical protein SAMD00019534_070690, partial [Acytostelium subglobosum LB1]|uniref:hypothetical protein n=1 Tax=Acytostelium subglobosum LB1 TaxID=1410327 RepID=UPI000644F615